ncbi:MAG: tetratricopeptide repeat protein [Bdellovibrionales bacterium]|nr:tetratricopeptide repeat protein [Bdellovibrionales bacterium]
MNEINPEFIERYQLLYSKNPKSKIFAPLAEAYRKMGLIEEALEIAQSGVDVHPEFSGGYLTLAKILMDQEKWSEAAQNLKRAVELSPENLLAQSTLADLLVRLKDPKGALKAYKMLLFLQPDNEKARKAVAKLESLTADEYETDAFSMQPLKDAMRHKPSPQSHLRPLAEDQEASSQDSLQSKALERYLSLVDAFLVRNELERATETLEDAERQFGQHPEILKRFRLTQHGPWNSELNQIEAQEPGATLRDDKSTKTDIPKSRITQSKEEKVQFLKQLRHHISQQRDSKI